MTTHHLGRPALLRAARVSDPSDGDRVAREPVTIEMVGAPGELGLALAAYAQAVSLRLSAQGLLAATVCVFAPTPHRPLSASMLLGESTAGKWAQLARHPCGWHEELGWWIRDSRHNGPPGCAVPRWLGTLLPPADQAARLLWEALRHNESRRDGARHHTPEQLGDRDTTDRHPPVRVLRYRGTDEHVLLRDLCRAGQ